MCLASEKYKKSLSDLTHDWLLNLPANAVCTLVGFDRDLRTSSLSMAELWILNKSMATDWSGYPVATSL